MAKHYPIIIAATLVGLASDEMISFRPRMNTDPRHHEIKGPEHLQVQRIERAAEKKLRKMKRNARNAAFGGFR